MLKIAHTYKLFLFFLHQIMFCGYLKKLINDTEQTDRFQKYIILVFIFSGVHERINVMGLVQSKQQISFR